MNKKFFFTLLVIALFAVACAPVIAGNESPKDPAQPAALVPITGTSASVPAGAVEEPRLWSGEVFLSDNDNPDANTQINTRQDLYTECMSDDDLPRRYSGCVE